MEAERLTLGEIVLLISAVKEARKTMAAPDHKLWDEAYAQLHLKLERMLDEVR